MTFIVIGVVVLAFLGAQALHIHFNQFLLNPAITRWGLRGEGRERSILLALLYGLSAGVFEEGARYLAYRFWLSSGGHGVQIIGDLRRP